MTRKISPPPTHEIIVGYVRIDIWCEATYSTPRFRFQVTRLTKDDLDAMPAGVRRLLVGTCDELTLVESATEDRDDCHDFKDNDFTDLMRAAALADCWIRAFARQHRELESLCQPGHSEVYEAAQECLTQARTVGERRAKDQD